MKDFHLDELEIQNEIQEIQENISNSKFDSLFKNNIVGQLGQFGFTFLKSGFEGITSTYLKKRRIIF
jgi:hypothetical protein